MKKREKFIVFLSTPFFFLAVDCSNHRQKIKFWEGAMRADYQIEMFWILLSKPKVVFS